MFWIHLNIWCRSKVELIGEFEGKFLMSFIYAIFMYTCELHVVNLNLITQHSAPRALQVVVTMDYSARQIERVACRDFKPGQVHFSFTGPFCDDEKHRNHPPEGSPDGRTRAPRYPRHLGPFQRWRILPSSCSGTWSLGYRVDYRRDTYGKKTIKG